MPPVTMIEAAIRDVQIAMRDEREADEQHTAAAAALERAVEQAESAGTRRRSAELALLTLLREVRS